MGLLGARVVSGRRFSARIGNSGFVLGSGIALLGSVMVPFKMKKGGSCKKFEPHIRSWA